jgi:selenide, water dikinase
MKRLVLIGGGHSHLFVLEAFGKAPVDKVELTLVDRARHTPYSGMLPGLIAGHYSFLDCHIDLKRLCRYAKIGFIEDEAAHVNLEARRVHLRGGATIEYDFLSLDIGSTPPLDTPGARGFVVPIKPIGTFLQEWVALQSRALANREALKVALVGGGAASVEMALAMGYKLHKLAARPLNLAIITDEAAALAKHNWLVQRSFARLLRRRGVTLRLRSRVDKVESGVLFFPDGSRAGFDCVVWLTGAAAATWPQRAGLATDARGFVAVNDSLQSISHAEVFAAGDIAHQVNHPRPKMGVYAVRQGPALARNLRHALLGETLEAYIPQKRALALISAGNKYAIASWGSACIGGAWVWRWKDRIDRRFVDRFHALTAIGADTQLGVSL